jgi:hypothetical protein
MTLLNVFLPLRSCCTLVGEGWDDLFLDLDPERGIAAGERWERALNEAARRCRGLNIGLN